MAKHYSLRRRLIWVTSVFSLLLGCILVFTAYKVALHETNQILDEQMRYLADRTARQPLYNLDSHFQANHEYHEEDLLVDIWAYDDQRHLQDENQLLMPPVKKPGFIRKRHVRAPCAPMSCL